MNEMSLLSHSFPNVNEGTQSSTVASSDRIIHNTYTLEEAKTLCLIIKEISVFSSAMDWKKIAGEGVKHRNFFLSEADCCRLWKFLAYGEWYQKKEDALVYESDEEDFYFSPSEAIKRHQKRLLEIKEKSSLNNEHDPTYQRKRCKRLLRESEENNNNFNTFERTQEPDNEEDQDREKELSSTAFLTVDTSTEFHLAKSPKADIVNPIVSLFLFLSFFIPSSQLCDSLSDYDSESN
jgi:hypothetical protein